MVLAELVAGRGDVVFDVFFVLNSCPPHTDRQSRRMRPADHRARARKSRSFISATDSSGETDPAVAVHHGGFDGEGSILDRCEPVLDASGAPNEVALVRPERIDRCQNGAMVDAVRLELRNASRELGHRSGHAVTVVGDDEAEVAFAEVPPGRRLVDRSGARGPPLSSESARPPT